MAMTRYKTDSEEEALFRSYPYAFYFVQSPSTVSHANSATANIIINDSPLRQEPPATRLLAAAVSSRYSSSSRGSNNSLILHAEDGKKKYSHEDQCHTIEKLKNGVLVHSCHDHDDGGGGGGGGGGDDDDDDDGYYSSYDGVKNRGWTKYFSFSTYSNSVWWILVQLSWRFLLSLMIALVVFYVAVKPPAPSISIKIAGIRQFRLGEGVDGSGVATKLLSCNCSIDLIIDNKSNLFGLHINPPNMELIFGHLPFALSKMEGRELFAESGGLTSFRSSVGTRNKAMYGAGRNMQDLLESGKGLPMIVRVRLRSSFHVVLGLFEPKYHHEAQCLVVLADKYDKKHRTQFYNSTCFVH